ncbi:MAG: phosphoglucosamine mutase [Endomicrobia bacterium]|nr:phosphoglucosamine mutase [Endomicrobiia bacterium]
MTSSSLFGTDGIRGVVGEPPLTKEFIQRIAVASSLVFKESYKTRKVIIGWDTRESSPWIADVLSKNISKAGYEVYLAGVFTTAGIAFLCRKEQALGVVISASHNPYQYNGIKFLSPSGTKISPKLEKKIEQVVKQYNKFSLKWNKKERVKLISYNDTAEKEYIEFLKKIFIADVNDNFKDKVSLVVDCGNGASYKIADKIFKQLFKKVECINIEPNGKNINATCGALYPETVKRYITDGQIGVSFDGDADRVIFVDEHGNVRDGDYIIGILATEYKKRKMLKNSLVVVSIMANLGLVRYLQKLKLKVIMCPVGDKYVSEYLKKYKGILGGEQAGHIVLYNYLPTGDGILTALEVLKAVIKNKTSLYNLSQIFSKYPQVLKNVKTQVKPPVEEIFEKEFLQSLEKKIDGRIVLRYSGTEPLFRIMVEGRNEQKIREVVNIIENKFNQYIKVCEV